MNSMFSDCESLRNIDLSNFNTQNVNNMAYMFQGCKKLTMLTLHNFNAEKVNDISWLYVL